MDEEIIIREPERKTENTRAKKKADRNKLGIYMGLVLILVGILWYGISTGLIPETYLKFWPQLLIIILGVLILIKSL